MAADSDVIAYSERERMLRKGHRQAWWIVAAVLVPPFAWTAWKSTEWLAEPKPFSSTEWKATWSWTPRGRQTRQYMANDLLAKQRLEGRSRENILEMLGEPNSEHPVKTTNRFVYYYRLNRNCIDAANLSICFDENDLVVSAGIVSD